jgi:hypothetical protein
MEEGRETDLLTVAEQTLHYLRRPHDAALDGPLESAAAWRSKDLRERTQDWIVELSSSQIQELEGAYEIGRALPLSELTRSSFPLPTLAQEIQRWRDQVAGGLGVVLVRGLPVREWGEEKSSRIYWGVGCHLGCPGVQNEMGELLGHVRDTRESERDPNVRLYKTASDIAFHCDAADAVGLLCLETARTGGASRIVSSVAVFNRLVETQPKLAARLFDPVLLDVRSENEEGGLRHFPVPPCRYAEGVLRTFYHSDYFRSVVRHPDVPPLGELEEALFDAYEAIAGSPEFHFDMQLEPGDLQLISNHTILHSRTGYEEYPERRRHLLRLWLSL